VSRARTPSYAEQPLAHDQVDDEREVDDERRDLDVGHVLGQLMDLERQEDAGADDSDVLTPALEAPQTDPLGHLEEGVDDEERLHEVQRAVLRVEQPLDLVDGRALREVVVERGRERLEPRQVTVEQLLQ
jgi:hypothetical protein